MSIDINSSNEGSVVVINDEMTIYTAAELKSNLTELLIEKDEIEVSLEKVCNIDCAGVQLLLLLKNAALESKKKLHFINHSTEVIDVLELLNLTNTLGDPIVLPAGNS